MNKEDRNYTRNRKNKQFQKFLTNSISVKRKFTTKKMSSPVKLTCHGATKRNAYIHPVAYLHDLKNNIIQYLFDNGEAVQRDFRLYWIDQDNDEIDVINQNDYGMFLDACKDRLHLHAVTKSKDDSKSNQGTAPKAQIDGMFPSKAVHTHVECNNCMLKPLVGFRYKCVECHDYDLCQACEAKHVHAEHMMVRMPNSDCPNLIEAWVTGRSKRSHKRGGRTSCPFVATAPEAPNAGDTSAGDSKRHHRRPHRRHEFNNGVFGHLYKIMVDLAEGGVQVNEEAAANAANAAADSANTATTTAANAAATAATTAKAAAKAAASAASEAAKVTAETWKLARDAESAEKNETKHEQSTNTGAKPKSAQSVPTTATANNSEPSSVPHTSSLENLAQYIDPQYMRTGIEILNNFSEMFAKMLDPEDGVGMSCPFDTDTNNEARKNSTTSTTSTNSKATSTNVEQSNVGSQAPVEKETENEVPTSTIESPKVSTAAGSPEQRRSQSFEENDWQLIDQQTATADMASADTQPAKPIDFAQLSKDLRAHIEDEQKRQEASQQPQAAAIQTTSETANVSTITPTTHSAPLTVPVSQSAPQPTAPPKSTDEKRGVLFYHPDPRINNSVHAMIAMGFSNEGAWLTQLLESVNGSIPDALDLMNAAQRNSN